VGMNGKKETPPEGLRAASGVFEAPSECEGWKARLSALPRCKVAPHSNAHI
jgi:hypothetical protein